MNSEFPRIITEERKKRKLSQKQAAADLGISQALLSHYEKGIRECGLDFVVKIADYYNVSCDLLLGHWDNRESKDEKTNSRVDIEAVAKMAEYLLSSCEKRGGQELEKEVMSCIMLNFYKLFRILDRLDGEEHGAICRIPKAPAENLADSAMMNLCASIKIRRSEDDTEIFSPNDYLRDLIRVSELKISEFNKSYF